MQQCDCFSCCVYSWHISQASCLAKMISVLWQFPHFKHTQKKPAAIRSFLTFVLLFVPKNRPADTCFNPVHICVDPPVLTNGLNDHRSLQNTSHEVCPQSDRVVVLKWETEIEWKRLHVLASSFIVWHVCAISQMSLIEEVDPRWCRRLYFRIARARDVALFCYILEFFAAVRW